VVETRSVELSSLLALACTPTLCSADGGAVGRLGAGRRMAHRPVNLCCLRDKDAGKELLLG